MNQNEIRTAFGQSVQGVKELRARRNEIGEDDAERFSAEKSRAFLQAFRDRNATAGFGSLQELLHFGQVRPPARERKKRRGGSAGCEESECVSVFRKQVGPDPCRLAGGLELLFERHRERSVHYEKTTQTRLDGGQLDVVFFGPGAQPLIEETNVVSGYVGTRLGGGDGESSEPCAVTAQELFRSPPPGRFLERGDNALLGNGKLPPRMRPVTLPGSSPEPHPGPRRVGFPRPRH